MPLHKQDDGAGHSVTYVDTDGCLTCTFGHAPDVQEAIVRDIPNFKCLPDDVFICTPPKSGTHWTWEIISMLYNGNAETIPKSKVAHMLEAIPAEKLEHLPSPRVLNTHMHLKYIPKDATQLKCKIVHVLRNPKDTVTSFYFHTNGISLYGYDGEWQNFLRLFLEGKVEYNSWFEYVLEWEELMASNPDLPIHLIYFEDLKENSLHEVYRLGKFLSVENKDGLFEAISDKCQFANMAKDKRNYMVSDASVLQNGFSFFRKGDIGSWKERFTVAQNEGFDQVYSEQMNSSKHRFRYSYSEALKEQ